MATKTKVQQQRPAGISGTAPNSEDEMKRELVTKTRGSKRVSRVSGRQPPERHLPKALHAALRAGETGKTSPRVSFWWIKKNGELIWNEDDQFPKSEEYLQILQLHEHAPYTPPTEIILSQSEIAELRELIER